MNAEIFWEIIGNYNSRTWPVQIVLLALILTGFIFVQFGRAKMLPKLALGATNIFIGIVFFLAYGTEPIQHFFAAPLFMGAGLLFFWEGLKNRNDPFKRFNLFQWILFGIVLLYPIFSLLFGNSFPKMVVNIMPCPVISLSIVIYSGYHRKNRILLFLLSLWGLTGIKAFFFNALEDTILLVCGLYGIFLLIREFKISKKEINGETV